MCNCVKGGINTIVDDYYGEIVDEVEYQLMLKIY